MSDEWRKSTHSNSGGCVEVGHWRKSFRSNSQGACVEVGTGKDVVGVRDTKDNGKGPVLKFSGVQWAAFTRSLGR